MESQLINMIIDYDLLNEVQLLGSMKPEEVREHMEKANIFLFTSDFNEGWGAVLNESMNSGCGVIASHAIGSVPFLIKNKSNGLIYKNGDINHLYKNVIYLLNHDKECQEMGINAYNTLQNSWNAKIAAERIIEVSEGLLNGCIPEYKEGPCSLAENISQKYRY